MDKGLHNKVRIFVVDHREKPERSFLPIIGVGNNHKGDYSDQVGDNIAHLNPYINEATAIYWIWKHLADVAPNAEMIGICHYRRFWALKWHRRYALWTSFLTKRLNRANVLGYRSWMFRIKKKLNKADGFIVDWRQIWGTESETGTIKEVFHRSFLKKTPELFDECIERFTEGFPELGNEIQDYINESQAHPFNMSVVSISEFKRYCEFMFPLIIPFAERIRDSEVGNIPVLRRGAGYLFEHMSGLYWHCRMLQGLKLVPMVPRISIDFSTYKPSN